MKKQAVNEALELIEGSLNSGRLTLNKLQDESGVLVDRRDEQLITLNRTATFLIEAIATGQTDSGPLADKLATHFDIRLETAKNDVSLFAIRLVATLKPEVHQPSQ